MAKMPIKSKVPTKKKKQEMKFPFVNLLSICLLLPFTLLQGIFSILLYSKEIDVILLIYQTVIMFITIPLALIVLCLVIGYLLRNRSFKKLIPTLVILFLYLVMLLSFAIYIW